MIQTLTKNWWLLALCGGLNAIFSATYLIMQDPDGALAFRKYAVRGTVLFLGKLAMAAGVCTIAAGIWRSAQGKCWPLVLNGLALTTLGLTFSGVFGNRISFRSIADLLVVMAVSIAVLEVLTARTLRRRIRDQWFPGLARGVSIAFALAFLWIKPGPALYLDFLFPGSYFAFSAICMLWLGLRLHNAGLSGSAQREA